MEAHRPGQRGIERPDRVLIGEIDSGGYTHPAVAGVGKSFKLGGDEVGHVTRRPRRQQLADDGGPQDARAAGDHDVPSAEVHAVPYQGEPLAAYSTPRRWE